MDIFGVLTMVGGLALFLYGMNVMGDSLARLSGGKLEQILEKLTSKKIMAVILGLAVTAVIQSSSATTVMVVGFVNSGIMQLSQAVGIIMGANIGTTVTSWMLSLTGIEGAGWINLLKPSSFSPVLAAVGIIMLMTCKDNSKKKDIGSIFLGFAILMFGMETMSDAVAPLAQNEKFTGILTIFSNPLFGLLAGTVLTAVIQSSSASVGILQALCLTGAVNYATAIPIIMGQNIGTCITALISSIGAKKNAKRASMIHLYFNMMGTVIFMVLFYSLNALLQFDFLSNPANAAGIAVIHSLFNIGCVVVLYPFSNVLVKLATLSIPDGKHEDVVQTKVAADLAALDERFLETPGVAMELCRNTAVKMAKVSQEALDKALAVIYNYSDSAYNEVAALEEDVDQYEDKLGSYLVKVGNCDLSRHDNHTFSILLHCMSDFERISDHAINIAKSAKEMHEKDAYFSKNALKELETFARAVHDIVNETVKVFENQDIEAAKHIEPLEQVIDGLNLEIKQRHIGRLRKGQCTIETGLILEDIITNFERVSDHCSNIAVCMIEVRDNGFETHGYLEHLTNEDNPEFAKECMGYYKLYQLPELEAAD
ncbi:MAG: Na/Pi cotransporter family protein [Clostridia bacterium]|nr:Na/Pi cotransporter family protein [Clostridia bacterium]